MVLVVDLLAFGLYSLPTLRTAVWSTSSVVVFGLAALCIVWVGYWILYSRTRLDGDVMTQTWLWTKRVDAREVSQLKLVHWRWLERIVSPRLLVRRRNGGAGWFNSADARLLIAFSERVAKRLRP